MTWSCAKTYYPTFPSFGSWSYAKTYTKTWLRW